ncbi:tetratricopeptide repeat protein [Alteromonas stellipolaris]|uniref:PEP-CTERM system TPR-repeat protein PrsT n=1 Tax=Alteromonas stellipolaris TaxID=233316 RepID=A0ABM5YLL9_9ALTE|nr:tetratricopeptide repeat protein [Alteromonas stellipolaris]ALM89563.1 hypothetical protein AOR13_511 [Alteromonas stellipolaris LMG 21856]AMJ75330.1 hypothetical protein AVL57_15965 [Alteromonas stellipolaris]
MYYNRIVIITLMFLLFSISSNAIEVEEQYFESALESMSQQDSESAYIHLKNALAANPNHVPSKILMGKILYKKGFFDAALQELHDAEQLGADKNLTAVTIARALLVLKSYSRILSIDTASLKQDIAFEVLLIKSSAQHQSPKPKEAIQYLNQANELQPNSLRVIQTYASHYLNLNDFERAKSYIQKASSKYGENPQTLHLRGQLAYRQGDTQEAVSFLERAHSLSAENPIIMRSLASAYMAIDNNDDALKIVQTIVDQTPGDPYVKLLLGQLRAKNNQTEIAKQVFDELLAALTLLPEDIMQSSQELQFINAFASYLNEDYESAVKAFSTYLANNEDSVKALALLADTYIKLDTPKDALTLLDRRQTLVTRNIPLTVTLCNLFIENNRSFKCDRLIEQAEFIHGPQATFSYVRMNSLIERSRFDDALSVFNETFSEAQDEKLKLLGIQLKMQTSSYQAALDDIKDLYPTTEDMNRLKLLEAKVQDSWGNLEAAKAITQEIVKHNPNAPGALILHTEVLLKLNEVDEALVIAEQLFQRNPNLAHTLLLGEALAKSNNIEAALSLLLAAKRDIPQSTPISGLLLEIYINSEQHENALIEVGELLKQNRLDQTALVAKASLLTKMGQYEKARLALNILYGLWSDNPRLLVKLSKLQINANDLTGARTSLTDAKTIAPDSVTIALEEAKLNLMANQLDGLEKTIDAIQAKAPNSPEVYLLAGNFYNATNDKQKAFSAFSHAFELDPHTSIHAASLFQSASSESMFIAFEELMLPYVEKYPNAYFHKRLLADFYLIQGEHDNAKTLYEFLSKIDALFDKATVLNNLAYIETKDDLPRALKYAEEALSLSPNTPQILDTYGWVLALQGNYTEALPNLRKAYSFDAVDPNIMYHLGFVLFKQGKHQQAKVELANALASDLPFAEKEEARALFNSL